MRPAQIIPGLPISHPHSVPHRVPPGDFSRGIEESVYASKMRLRRRWFIRTLAMLLGMGVVLCLLVVLERDDVSKSGALRAAEPARAALQDRIEALGALPLEMPGLEGRYTVSDAVRFYAAHSPEPVIVAIFGKVPLILGRDGLCVLVYEHGQARTEWLALTEFRARWIDQEHRIKTFEAERRAQPPQLP